MSVEKGWDEVWVAVKFQTNLEIAGSLRNSLGGASESRILEVEHCLDEGPVMGYPNSDKLRMPMIYVRSQTMSDKIHIKREHPDHQLRSLNIC